MSEVLTVPPSTATTNATLTPMAMIDRALANNAGIETLEKLMALQERYDANQARRAFDNAMAELRADLPDIVKTSTVDYTHKGTRTHYKYEDLSAVTSALSPVMASHGLSFRWRTNQQDGGVTVTCVISHRDGHFEETSLHAAPDNSAGKNGIQSIGSTVTYLQRYALKAAVGVAASHDDDGQGATIPPANNGRDRNITADQWGENRANELSEHMRQPSQTQVNAYDEMIGDVESADSVDALTVWFESNKTKIDALPESLKAKLRDAYAEKKVDIVQGPVNGEYLERNDGHVQ